MQTAFVRSFVVGLVVVVGSATSSQAWFYFDNDEEEPGPEYVQVCSVYGQGYYYIPGTETCLKLTGRIRVDERAAPFYLFKPRDDRANSFCANDKAGSYYIPFANKCGWTANGNIYYSESNVRQKLAGYRPTYTSPTFAGFVFGSQTQQDYWDTSVRYAGEFGGFRIAAGIGFESNNTDFNGSNHFDRFAGPDEIAFWSTDQTKTRFVVDARLEMGMGRFQSFIGIGGSFGSETSGSIFIPYAVNDNVLVNYSLNPNVFNVHAGVKVPLFDLPAINGQFSIAPNVGLYLQRFKIQQSGQAGGPYVSSVSVDSWTPAFGVEAQIDVAAMQFYLGYRHYVSSVGDSVAGSTPNASIVSAINTDVDVFTGGARIRF